MATRPSSTLRFVPARVEARGPPDPMVAVTSVAPRSRAARATRTRKTARAWSRTLAGGLGNEANNVLIDRPRGHPGARSGRCDSEAVRHAPHLLCACRDRDE